MILGVINHSWLCITMRRISNVIDGINHYCAVLTFAFGASVSQSGKGLHQHSSSESLQLASKESAIL